MCGIVGALSLTDVSQSIGALQAMTDAIRSRGPDDQGHWHDADAGIVLGHRRLSIVDLSPAGHQPMLSAGGRLTIAFNGEIYNHMDLRAELERKGRAPEWRGHSDTETLLAAIAAWGTEEALRRTIGMFAFALWDREARTLTLARDRMGEKPLYYGWQGRHFLFGSEIAALRPHPAFRAEINRGAIALMMRHNYVPAPYSIYAGISKLVPGTILTISVDAPEAQPRSWWSVAACVEEGLAQPFQGTPDEAVDQLETLLRDAVARQMEADVPLGAFLSGGIDSSTVVALMQAQSSRPVKTFTIGFSEAGFNEAEYAKSVAQHLGTDHTEMYVSPEDALAVIPKLPTIYSEPFSDSSQIPTYLVSQLARRHVTVSLSGDGGDELFGGYGRYATTEAYRRKFSRIPEPLRRASAGIIRTLDVDTWNRLTRPILRSLPKRLHKRNPGAMVYKLASALENCDIDQVYRIAVSHWQPNALLPDVTEPPTQLTAPGTMPVMADTLRMMALDSVSYLPDDILCKVDRAAMAVSLESRVPMLDHRVVEFAWTLPLALKVRNGVGKWPLRGVLRRHVPDELIDRPKMGFGVPIGEWLRGPLREWAEDLLDEKRLREQGLFRPDLIRQRWQEHLSGASNWQYLLWDVLMFQAWHAEQPR